MPVDLEKLTKLRTQRGWSMGDAGKAIGASRQYWSKLEGGGLTNLSLPTLDKLARAFDVHPGELLKDPREAQ